MHFWERKMPKGITDLPSTTAQQIPSTEKENIAVNKAAKPRAQSSPKEAAQSTPLIARTSEWMKNARPLSLSLRLWTKMI